MSVNLDDLTTIDGYKVAEILGKDYSDVMKMVRRGELPHIRIGRRVRFRVAALREWMRQQEEQATRRRSAAA